MFHALPSEEDEFISKPAHRSRVVHNLYRQKHQSVPQQKLVKLFYQPVMAIHRDTQNYAEENDYTLLQGRRSKLYGPHAKYELKVSNKNASQPFEGIYMCSLERRMDKMYITSSITMYGNLSPLPAIPQVEFISCEKDNYVKSQHFNILTLSRDRETCIRCRGIGFPRPLVGIYRENQEIQSGRHITVSKYINVADGGVSESTYVLHNYNALRAGKHSCRAANDQGSTSIHFKVIY